MIAKSLLAVPQASRSFRASDYRRQPNRRILIVDDNASIQSDFRKILSADDADNIEAEEGMLFGRRTALVRPAQFSLDSAFQGQQALELVRSSVERGERYAVVFIDERMPPGWNGLKTTEKLWEVDPDLQIVICTGHSDYTWEEMMEAISFPERMLILKKPFDAIEVLQLAHALAEKWSLLQVSRSNTTVLEHAVEDRISELKGVNELLESEVEKLRDSEMNLALAQQVSHMGSWEMILDSAVPDADRNLHWSDEQFRIFGLEPGSVEATQRLFFELVHGDDRKRVRATFASALESGQPCNFEHRITWHDGTEREVHEQVHFLRDKENGPIVKVIGTTQEVTERKEAERVLREQAEMLNLAHDAIVVRRCKDRVITFWNKGAERLYGWTAKEAIGKRIDELLYPDRDHYDAVAEAVETTGEFRGEVHQVTKDGRRLVVNARANVIQKGSGMPNSVLIIQTDVTQHKELEAQFLRAQRLESIGTLASGVAHDLNNILAPILMSTPLLRGELTAELKAKVVDTIEKSAERGAQIVKQVLTFARGADGEHILMNPKHLVQEMAEIVDQTFPKSIQVTSRYSDELGLVEGDPTQLHQVLLNLCLNARDAMASGGTLMLSAENFFVDEHYASMMPEAKCGPHVLITVRDTGVGIPANIIDKIFDPFFTTKQVGHGTGLGLSTLLGIVKGHGGFVVAQSEPGNGTTFRIYLPEASGTEVIGEATGAPPEGHGEGVLIVDDEPAILAVTKQVLESHNYRVFCAEDGPDAVALFAQEMDGIDLVITDLMMPCMDGVSVVRSTKKMKPGTHFIASTGMGEQTRTAELAELGVNAHLFKPFNHVRLLRTMREIIDGVQPATERAT
ncbi:MAG: response regulator [Verrucomicrobiota bacterium]